jgi:hypothetical protein
MARVRVSNSSGGCFIADSATAPLLLLRIAAGAKR